MSKYKGIEFIGVVEVIALHIERYNRQIARLLAVEDYPNSQRKAIDRFQFTAARERRIKAYMDCLSTINQKEKILQYHRSGFTFEVVEKQTVIERKQPLALDRLSWDQKLELYYLMRKAEQRVYEVRGISSNQELPGGQSYILPEPTESTPNISFIELEQRKDNITDEQVKRTIPHTEKMKDAFNRMAAKQFKDAGSTLTEDEQKLLND